MVWMVQRRDRGYSGERMPNMELPGRRKKDESRRRFMNVMKEAMQRFGVTEEGARDTDELLC